MILSDFHTHTSNSGDSDTKMSLQIQSAREKGVKHLCFTDHLDYDYPLPPKAEYEVCNFDLDVKSYFEDFKANSSACNDINLYFGVEVGLMPYLANRNDSFVKSMDFDFVIGSVHLLDKEDPYYPEYWEDKNEKDVLRRYFEYTYENICEFSNFDVSGHIDYIIRYCKNKDKSFSYNDYSDEIDSILKKLIETGRGIEINTGGLKNGLINPNPHPDIVRRYKELGGEIITIGSDAHSPEYIAYRFDAATAILENAGFKYYSIFKNRKPEFLLL